MKKSREPKSSSCTETESPKILVDPEDEHFLTEYNWKLQKRSNRPTHTLYARAYSHMENGKQVNILLHRLIMNAPKGVQVDHENHNGLDCHRSNLRLATQSQNQYNSLLRSDNTSDFKGVYWDESHKKWRARIQIEGHRVHLGSYTSKEEAVKVYVDCARRVQGEFYCES